MIPKFTDQQPCFLVHQPNLLAPHITYNAEMENFAEHIQAQFFSTRRSMWFSLIQIVQTIGWNFISFIHISLHGHSSWNWHDVYKDGVQLFRWAPTVHSSPVLHLFVNKTHYACECL